MLSFYDKIVITLKKSYPKNFYVNAPRIIEPIIHIPIPSIPHIIKNSSHSEPSVLIYKQREGKFKSLTISIGF